MHQYTKLHLRDSKPIILQNPQPVTLLGAKCITGLEVNRQGEPVGTATLARRQHIIQLSIVKSMTPLRMNLHYGELEPA